MKLATLKDGTRDGQLVVVSRDLHTAVIADAIAPTLQRVIEDWSFYAPQLTALYDALNAGRARRAFGFDPAHCMAPLPRAYRLVAHRTQAFAAGDASSTPVSDADNPVGDAVSAPRRASTRAARAALSVVPAMPDVLAFAAQRLTERRGDTLLAACEDVRAFGPAHRAMLRFTAGVAVILGDIAPAASPAQARDSVRLLMLATSFESGPADAGADAIAQDICGFSPVAITPDELEGAWSGARLQLEADVQINGRRIAPDAQAGGASLAATWPVVADFALLAAAVARVQGVVAGTVLLSAPEDRASALQAVVSTCLQAGDRARVDFTDGQGNSVFGVTEQSVMAFDEV